jgi:predicted TPR repeat methyltransferase
MPGENGADPVPRAELLLDAGEASQASRILEALVRAGRGGERARLALGRAQQALGDIAAALDSFREACMLAPESAPAAFAHGEALLAAETVPAAIAELQRALRLAPDDDGARYTLGTAWAEAGEDARARDYFTVLAQSSSVFAARAANMLDALDARGGGARAAPNYVRHLFDQFAENYDAHMVGALAYRAPGVLRELADLVMGARGPRSLAILDLGCGTGLSGECFRDLAARLEGIDLSPAMLAKARARGIYDTLETADLESALAGQGRSYDLILAADTLVYLGNLQPVFQGAASRLAPGGFFLFTVESVAGETYELGPKRRYRHSEAYLRREAEAASLDVMGLVACAPRRETGIAVEGFAVALRRC